MSSRKETTRPGATSGARSGNTPGAGEWLERALELAARGRYTTAPNPCVGALVVQGDAVVGEGWHRRPGEPHAEVLALEAAGTKARGATLYVTLEPCAHHGRTPPCADAVIAAGLTRVVVCHADPDPRVSGRGLERIRAAGIEVEVGPLAERARQLNLAYLIAHREKRAAVTLKWAMSLDGRIATARGESQWISSPEARQWALSLREEHGAILVGSGTALADDPRLTRRLGLRGGEITRVIVDRRLRLAPEARLFKEPGPVLVYSEARDQQAIERLEKAGATVVRPPAGGSMTPGDIAVDLLERGCQSVLIEGGAGIAGAFFDASVWDRAAICCAPRLIGGEEAPGPLAGRGVEKLALARRLEAASVVLCGTDFVIEGVRPGCLRD